jgi:DDE family transposase
MADERAIVEGAATRVAGMRLMRRMRKLLRRLRPVGTERDRAGNRQLFFDQYTALLLLYFFTPAVTSLRALQQTTNWEVTRKKLGIQRTSLGSLSEAARVFPAEHLRAIVRELAAEALPLSKGSEAEALRGLTAVDGSVFQTCSRMTWALWQNAEHKAVKLHLHFDVLKRVPCDAVVTPGRRQDSAVLPDMLQPGRLYVLDRGYADYELLGRVVRAGSSLVARLKNEAAYTLLEERPLSQTARQAGVTRDLIISRLGSGSRPDQFRQPMRLVIVQTTDRNQKPVTLTLLTDRLDLDAELIAQAYRYRWTIELFFRWLKCVLGARHFIAENQNGVELEMYAALIVSLLIVLRTQRRPTRRTFETIQFYLLGWVNDAEFDAHLAALANVQKKR